MVCRLRAMRMILERVDHVDGVKIVDGILRAEDFGGGVALAGK